jgi:hypothetical protein
MNSRFEYFALGQSIEPFWRNALNAPIGASQLPTNGSGRVGIVPQVDGFENRLAEIRRVVKGPQGRFEGPDDVTTPRDF